MDRFITDAGRELYAVGEDGERIDLGRFGFWVARERDGKPEVIATSNDLAELVAEHGEAPVYRLDGPPR